MSEHDTPGRPRPHPFLRDPMFPDDGTPHACRECWAHEGAAWHTPEPAHGPPFNPDWNIVRWEKRP